jgi:hypothetical protein
MASTKISGLTGVTSAGLAQELLVNDNGTTKKMTIEKVLALIGIYKGVLGSDHTNSSTTGTEAFSIASLPAGTYWFENRYLAHSSSATCGPTFGVNFTGTATTGTTTLMAVTGGGGSSTGNVAVSLASSGLLEGCVKVGFATTAAIQTLTSFATISSAALYIHRGWFVATTSGDFEVWHASELAATLTTLVAGSTITLYRVA